MQSKKKKIKELRTIGESTWQVKISFVKLPRWIYKYQIIFNIDSSC